jgi:hypothetical protein
MRQWECFIYCENALQDQSTPNLFPSQCYLGGALGCQFWIYSETVQQSTQSTEILSGSTTSGCEIKSIRQNRDSDTSTLGSNVWLDTAGKVNAPFASRFLPVYEFKSKAARLSRADEGMWVNFQGNDGSFGSLFGGEYGIGFSRQDSDGTNIEFQTGNKQNGSFRTHSGGRASDYVQVAKGTVDAPTGFGTNEVFYRQRFFPHNGGGFSEVARMEVQTTTIGGGNKAGGEISFSLVRPNRTSIDEVFIITRNGDIELPHGLGTTGIIMTSPNGTRFKTIVNDSGVLVTSAV